MKNEITILFIGGGALILLLAFGQESAGVAGVGAAYAIFGIVTWITNTTHEDISPIISLLFFSAIVITTIIIQTAFLYRRGTIGLYGGYLGATFWGILLEALLLSAACSTMYVFGVGSRFHRRDLVIGSLGFNIMVILMGIFFRSEASDIVLERLISSTVTTLSGLIVGIPLYFLVARVPPQVDRILSRSSRKMQ